MRFALLLPLVVTLASASGCAPPASSPASTPTAPAAAADHHGPHMHRFQSADQWAKEFDDPARDAWQRPADVVAAMRLQPGMTVVDLGAGTGYFLPHLSRAVGPGGHVIALDIEPDMVRYMTERATREHLANVTARVVAVDDPGLPSGSVDRVLVVDTWHHIAGRPAYAAKLLAALAPGGAVFVVDFKLEASHGPPPEHRLAPSLVAAELAQGGLSAEILALPLPEQYVVAGRRP